MSAWRALVNEIARHGPMYGTAAQSSELGRARIVGVITHDETGRWILTPLGVELYEGRIVQVEKRPGGRYFAATWLRALPKNLSISS